MTIRTLYRPTHLDQPVSGPRGWLILAGALVTWLAFVVGAYGLFTLIGVGA